MTKRNAVAKAANTGIVEADQFFDGEDIDSGYGNTATADVALPRYAVLQGLSPQVDSRGEEYIDGAKVGDICNLATGRVAESFHVVFAAYERRHVEWSPRKADVACPLEGFPQTFGEGLIQDHGTDDTVLAKATKDDETGRLWMPSGNELIVTGTWYLIDLATMSAGFMALGRTQYTASRKMMAAVRDEKVSWRGTLRMAPIFWRTWNLSSLRREREDNKWYVPRITPGALLQESPHGKDILGLVKDLQGSLKEATITINLDGVEEAAETENM